MDIAVAIFKDQTNVYKAIIPAMSNCQAWGNTIDQTMQSAKEAIHGHIESMIDLGQQVDIKEIRIEDLAILQEYTGAVWALVDVDLAQFDSYPVKISLNFPRFILRKIDLLATQLGEKRDDLLSRATLNFIAAEYKKTALAQAKA